MSDLLHRATEQFLACCVRAPRYRVAWLVGPAQRSSKSLLAQELCTRNNWAYLDYTLTPGYFDRLAPVVDRYQPHELVAEIRRWCAECAHPVLVLDELDALLATWDRAQRHVWAGQTARLQFLACGLVIVSHFFDQGTLMPLLPDRDPRYCLDLSGDLG
jgi:hypothetical protein